jgi:hypothetical protein
VQIEGYRCRQLSRHTVALKQRCSMESIKKLFLSRIIIFVWLDIIILLLLISFFICGRIYYEPIKIDSPILYPDSSFHTSNTELFAHNADLISTLQERESLEANSISSENNGLRQTRSIYIGIIGVLLTFVFRKNERNNAYIIILVLIFLFYGLDIHLVDAINRSTDSKTITSKALELVINQKPNDAIWCDVNYTQRNSQFDKMHDTRIPRKLLAAFNPDIVQTIFFVLPLVIIYIISTFKYRKK